MKARRNLIQIWLLLLALSIFSLHLSAAFAQGVNITAAFYNFTFCPSSGNWQTNGDGRWPLGILVSSGNTLYGTAFDGGINAEGTVFKVNNAGSGCKAVCSFVPSSSADGPEGGVVLSGNTLYGTTFYGGSNGVGTVFKVNTNGTGFAVLHHFTAGIGAFQTNSDGIQPLAGLILSGNTLYGTATLGDIAGYYGTVFKINTDGVNTDGTGFTNLYGFTGVATDVVCWPD